MDKSSVALAQTFAEIARVLLAETDVQATLDKICRLAVATVDGCDHAGITMVKGREISTLAASDDVPRHVDAIQAEVDEGPCVSAFREHETFRTDDLRTEDRWSRFSHRAAQETGVVSMLSLRLFIEEDTIGALNLYSKEKAAFDDDALAVGSVFAVHAAVAASGAQHHEHMEQAVQTRDVIGQAKGILMAQQNVSADEAFDMLRRASQRMNLKLRAVAERVAAREPQDDEDR